MIAAPVKLSATLGPVLAELSRRFTDQQKIRALELSIAELQARRAFHLDPTPHNLTAWATAAEMLAELGERE